MLALNRQQLEVIQRPLGERCFLEGKVGCGKTTAAVERLLYLMQAGVPAHQILIYVPQRTLAQPYRQALAVPGVMAGGAVTILTLSGLARRTIETFWPLVVEQAAFGQADEWPVFLTLETAQYFMAKLVQPLLAQGYFASVNLHPNRLYSQILDNLNKAALVGFPHTEIGERLKKAWSGSPGQLSIYDDVQTCANLFRAFCLEHNLLDFSLQVEVFVRYLWPNPLVRQHIQSQYRHLIADNIEEDAPVSHDILRQWLPQFDSALLVYDHGGGYRVFLGADPSSAYSLKQACEVHFTFETSFVTNAALQQFEQSLLWAFGAPPPPPAPTTSQPPIQPLFERFYPQMLERVAAEVAQCVEDEGIPPSQVVILAPYLTDALRFTFADLLERRQIPLRSHRPSRALREEAEIRCLLTLAALAYPEALPPNTLQEFDLITALLQAIDGLDLARASLLARIVFRKTDGLPTLSSFEQIQAD
ncbi:MAG: UvrD-helicase domain-containing protein, partial [Anaerolineales bacterium]